MAEFDFQAAFDKVHERITDLRTDFTRVETELHRIVGNGQPGTLDKLDSRVVELEGWRQYAKGYWAALSVGVTGLGFVAHSMWDWFRAKH